MVNLKKVAVVSVNEEKGMGEGWEDESQMNSPKQPQVGKKSVIVWSL